MNIKKVVNNNIVFSQNEEGQEIIVMGKGLGFQKKIGEPIDESIVEKVFLITKEWNENKLTQLFSTIPIEYIQVANEIVGFAKVSLGRKLSENLHLSLTDHIHYAVERFQNGLQIKNALLWEIKRFYNHEYLIGKEALSIIKNRLNVELPEDEAGFIALHIVNAEMDSQAMNKVTEMTKVIQDILNIIKYDYQIEIDEYSLSYERFVTHLKFFVQRLFSGTKLDDEELTSFLFMLKDRYKREYTCALKINDYIEKSFGRSLEEDELIYLTIHIKRITNN